MKTRILVVSACAWLGTTLAAPLERTNPSRANEGGAASAPAVHPAFPCPTKGGEKAQGKAKGQAVDPSKRAQALREICARLGIGPGAAVADIGCGRGQDTMTFAEIVGHTAKVYAEEIGQGMLDAVAQNARKLGWKHVVTVLGGTEDPRLPDTTLDLISMHFVFHHFAKPQSMLVNFWKDLKPGGHLVVIDRERGPQREWPDMAGREKKHFWTGETTVVRLAREAGFLFQTAPEDLWPEKQAFVLVFKKPEDAASPSGDPDLPLLLNGAKAVSQLPPLPGEKSQILFLGIDRGRALLPPLRDRLRPGARVFDVVLEEWRTFAEEMPEGAAGESGDMLRTVKGDLPSLASGSLDAAIFADGFSRLWDPALLLLRLRSALRPDGWVAILDRKTAEDEPRPLATHRRRISPGRIRAEMESAGFKMVKELNPPAEDRLFILFRK